MINDTNIAWLTTWSKWRFGRFIRSSRETLGISVTSPSPPVKWPNNRLLGHLSRSKRKGENPKSSGWVADYTSMCKVAAVARSERAVREPAPTARMRAGF